MSRSDRPLFLKMAAQGEEGPRLTVFEISALALSLVWGGVGYYFLGGEGEEALSSGTHAALIAVPILAIWGAAFALRTIQRLKDERQELQLTLDALRQAQGLSTPAVRSSLPRKTDELRSEAPAPMRMAPAAAMVPVATPIQAPIAAPAPQIEQSEQSDLGLGAEDTRQPIAIDEFIRALNFPDNPEDTEGFRCLRVALEDREAARLIRAAQDVLTLLAQDGIFMDDLTPDRAKPELWRRFAAGERGRSIAALGGIRDRSSIALTTGRMRSDTIFRDAAHHFLRQFDRSFQSFEKHAADQDLVELSDSRTARAFMLLSRVTGVFD